MSTGCFVLRNKHVGEDDDNVLLTVLHFRRQVGLCGVMWGYVLKHSPRAE